MACSDHHVCVTGSLPSVSWLSKLRRKRISIHIRLCANMDSTLLIPMTDLVLVLCALHQGNQAYFLAAIDIWEVWIKGKKGKCLGLVLMYILILKGIVRFGADLVSSQLTLWDTS